MIKVRNISGKLIGIENKSLFPGDEMVVSYVNDPLRAMERVGLIVIMETAEKKAAKPVVEEVKEPEAEAEQVSEEAAEEVPVKTAKKGGRPKKA